MKKKVILRTKDIQERIQELWYHWITKKEYNRYEDKLIEKLDSICSKIVLLRDQKKPCITKWIKVCKDGQVIRNCCHAIKRWYYSCRRDLRNLFAWCSACNCFGYQDHDGMIVAQMIKIHGQEVYDSLRENRSMEKPHLSDLEVLLIARESEHNEMLSQI